MYDLSLRHEETVFGNVCGHLERHLQERYNPDTSGLSRHTHLFHEDILEKNLDIMLALLGLALLEAQQSIS